MNKAELTQPPALDIDEALAKYHPQGLDERQKNERSIVWNLMAHLQREGFKLISVFDGMEYNRVDNDPKVAMELMFNLDEATLVVKRDGHEPRHGIWFIFDNGGYGLDVISDYGYTHGDVDEFDAIMTAFDVDALYS